MKARGYCRSFGETLPNILVQEKQIRDHCAYKKYELLQIYYDKEIGGKTLIRPMLQNLLIDLKTGEYLIFPTLAVMSETIKELLALFENLKEKQINIICLEADLDFTSSIGNLILNSFLTLYSLEKNVISKTVSSAMQKRSKEGTMRTRPPFGFQFVGKNEDFAPCPQQQRIIIKIKELYLKDRNLSKVATQLNADGDNYFLYENRRNPPAKIPLWKAEQVKRVLIDHGIIAKGNSKRMSMQQRIINHNGSESSSFSTSTNSTNISTNSINSTNLQQMQNMQSMQTFSMPNNLGNINSNQTLQTLQTIYIPNNLHGLPSVPSVPNVPSVSNLSNSNTLNNNQFGIGGNMISQPLLLSTSSVSEMKRPISIPIKDCSSDEECSDSDSD